MFTEIGYIAKTYALKCHSDPTYFVAKLLAKNSVTRGVKRLVVHLQHAGIMGHLILCSFKLSG